MNCIFYRNVETKEKMFQIGGLDLSPGCVCAHTGNGDLCPMMGCQICDISSLATIPCPPFPFWRGARQAHFSSSPDSSGLDCVQPAHRHIYTFLGVIVPAQSGLVN